MRSKSSTAGADQYNFIRDSENAEAGRLLARVSETSRVPALLRQIDLPPGNSERSHPRRLIGVEILLPESLCEPGLEISSELYFHAFKRTENGD